MEPVEMNKLAHAWMAYSRAFRKDNNSNEYFWAAEKLWELEEDDPESLWKIILIIHELNHDQEAVIVENLSAGPLEMLLTKHGKEFIDRIEVQAREDRKFATLLGGVWKNKMSDTIWSRIQAAWDISQWSGSVEGKNFGD